MLPQVYADYYEDGEFVFTGFNLGGEDAYFTNFLADAPSPLVTNWLQYMVLKCVPNIRSCGCVRGMLIGGTATRRGRSTSMTRACSRSRTPSTPEARTCVVLSPSCHALIYTHTLGQAIDPDLSAFAAAPHNGKVLHYVGLTDEIISPRNSLHYYETVRAQALSTGAMDVDNYYRLFPVPGMDHW